MDTVKYQVFSYSELFLNMHFHTITFISSNQEQFFSDVKDQINAATTEHTKIFLKHLIPYQPDNLALMPLAGKKIHLPRPSIKICFL